MISTTLILVLFMAIGLPLFANYSNHVLGSTKTPDTSFIHSSKNLYEIARRYCIYVRSAYIDLRWTFDVVWPLLYTSVLVLWTVKLSDFIFKKNRFKYLYLLPLISMGFDFMENVGASIVMYRYPKKTLFIDSMTPIMTLLKWVTVVGSLTVVICLMVLALKKRLKQRMNRP